jgi:hypothetical protein
MCHERRQHGAPSFGAGPDCIVRWDDYRARRGHVLALVDAIEASGIVPAVRFDSVLCDAHGCMTRLGATPLYRDKEHLSYAGSVALARKMELGSAVREKAR